MAKKLRPLEPRDLSLAADLELEGAWRVEYFDSDGAGYITISIGETGAPDRLEVLPGRPVSALRRAELFQRFPLNARNERGDALQLRRRVNRGTDPRNWVTE